MKITIIAIPKKHAAQLRPAIEDYSKRLAHYTSFNWKLLDIKTSNSLSQEQIKEAESALVLSHITPHDIVLLLDEHGQQLQSTELAEKIQGYRNNAGKNLVVVLGGAYGVSKPLKERADFTWSLSKLVFPHQLARLIVVEQLYRAHTILAGEKYHHR